MFENDDWDIDENYLKDFNEDSSVAFQDNKNETSCILDKKNEKMKVKLMVNCLQSQFNFNDSKFSNNDTNAQITDITSRRNTVLEILKKDNAMDTKHNKSNYCASQSILPAFKKPSTSKNQITSKSIFDIDTDVFTEDENSSKYSILTSQRTKSIIKLPAQSVEHTAKSENKHKRSRNVAFVESINDKNNSKKICSTIKNQFCYNEYSDLNKINLNGKKKKILLDILKSTTESSMKLPRIKQTVIRKFPGPAGLLPDDIDEYNTLDVDHVDECNKNNNRIDICSQNTKNLFTEGAWQLMMDDLPNNFELFEIATVKEKAVEFSKMFKKVPYLAGIVQYIDYKPNNPHIILKDFSGKIDACLHHAISKMYPNVLGTNIVLLVKDVGLIVTSKSYICIIISTKNLVSVYSDDERLVKTDLLEQLKNNNYDSNINESQISVLDEDEAFKTSKEELIERSVKHTKNVFIRNESLLKNKSCTNSSIKIHNLQSNKQSNLDSNCKLLKAKNFSEVIECTDNFYDLDFNEDDFSHQVNTENKTLSEDRIFSNALNNCTEKNRKNEGPNEKLHFISKTLSNSHSQHEKTKSEFKKLYSPKKSLNIKSLVQNSTKNFKNDKVAQNILFDKSTLPSESVYFKEGCIKKSDDDKQNKNEEKMFQNKCDADDDILSQIDVEAIVANYNMKNK